MALENTSLIDAKLSLIDDVAVEKVRPELISRIMKAINYIFIILYIIACDACCNCSSAVPVRKDSFS